MCDSIIPIICFYNGKTKRTKTYVKYVENKAVILPLDVSIDCTYDRLLAIIYSRTSIDKKKFKLVLTCKYPLKSGSRFQPCPIWDDNSSYQMLKLVNTTGMKEIELYLELVSVKPQVNQSVSTYTDLLLGGNANVEEFDYRCGPSSTPVAVTDRCAVYEDDQDCEDEDSDEDGDNESDGDGDVQADGHVSSFLTLHQLIENEQGRYVSVDVPSCDISNNPNLEDLDERGTVKYYLVHHLSLKMWKPLVMLFQVTRLHG